MAKRQDIIKVTVQSKTLKDMRIKNNLSIQKVADKMGISKTRVAQMEGGRGNITNEYVEKFLEAIEIDWADWIKEISEKSGYDDLLLKCHNVINQLGRDRLQKLFRFMMDYVIE